MQRGVAVMLLALWRAPVAALRAGGGAALRPRGTKPFGAFTRIPSAKAKRQANADAAKRKKAPTAASVRRREAREADAPAVAEGPAGAANPFGASPFGAGLPPIAGLMGGFDADFDIDDDDFDEDDEDDDDDDDDDGEEDPDSNKPPTLPSGAFRPKQSLGQNYLSDQNFVLKICNSLKVPEADAAKVVELGPGLGALTRILVKSYPEMLAVEIDERAVVLLRERYPAPTTILHCDVLELDYAKLAELKGGRLSVIGNLPYYITSQILFQFVDYHKYVARILRKSRQTPKGCVRCHAGSQDAVRNAVPVQDHPFPRAPRAGPRRRSHRVPARLDTPPTNLRGWALCGGPEKVAQDGPTRRPLKTATLSTVPRDDASRRPLETALYTVPLDGLSRRSLSTVPLYSPRDGRPSRRPLEAAL
ncbi:S-adenosyl-L-methionine-dependent methyltransferase [Pelagophyceae sp. CCMP2097]|nr:S-adenosyl-L-methionine-dependent methyltransferase [Pelagophyceae sp. CCMP2097]